METCAACTFILLAVTIPNAAHVTSPASASTRRGQPAFHLTRDSSVTVLSGSILSRVHKVFSYGAEKSPLHLYHVHYIK